MGTGPRTGREAGPGPSCGYLSSGAWGQRVFLYPAFLWLITTQPGYLPPVTLTLGLMELQGAFAGQPNFGPGLGRTVRAGYNQTGRGTILGFITCYSGSKLFKLFEPGFLT